MGEEQAKLLLLYISVGMKILTARLVLLLTLALTFGLFAWAMYLPTNERIALGTIFALLVFLPVISMDKGLKKDRAVITPKDEHE